MPHLGADVAAWVDGQLSDAAMQEAAAHLRECDECEKAVRQQRLLKSRMSTSSAPEPPQALLASLAHLAAAPPRSEAWWRRLTRAAPFRAGLVLAGAAIAVVATAYAVGSPERVGDEVAPPFERYVAEFTGPSTSGTGGTITAATMNQLDSSGWPCREILAGDLHRVSGSYTEEGEVIALTYSDGRSSLNLFEQAGVLDRDELSGFERARLGGSDVWVREGMPLVLAWDRDGTVFTVVTDVDRARVGRAVAELPRMTHESGPTERVTDGLTRMSSWLGAA
ncbi:anti-sigma factor family protein [Aeromicrobium chenweiae]|uniref:Uncharacterized protein n=1 Tax=Aeromicrobium chenweiae TaxID=2079793 RepID=A0A2S0WPF4_9ACTN|nr:hypothetical protein [Aeromicrobium chenweiae]AWB93196.1 hypothetical protein C3E78_13830 [Aeromicrobium chenweiae]TGN34186.1 hypothetical protein E4L97_03865 [Aeromicrobium chenweiae]